jgi:hypothetical protein
MQPRSGLARRGIVSRRSWFAVDGSLEPIDYDGPSFFRFTQAVAEHVIERYSAPGDLVIDPFCGFGTGLVVAERLGRHVVGCEADERRRAERDLHAAGGPRPRQHRRHRGRPWIRPRPRPGLRRPTRRGHNTRPACARTSAIRRPRRNSGTSDSSARDAAGGGLICSHDRRMFAGCDRAWRCRVSGWRPRSWWWRR